MALLTSSNLLASHCLYSLILSYLLLTAPQTLAQQNLIRTLGTSLNLPAASLPYAALSPLDLSGSPTMRSARPALSAESFQGDSSSADLFATPNVATAFAALLLAFTALNDAVGMSLPEPCFGNHWTLQSIVRLFVLFSLESWIYICRPNTPSLDGRIVDGPGALQTGTAWATNLKSDLVFTWAFLELVWTFWVFYLLRGERSRGAITREERRKMAD